MTDPAAAQTGRTSAALSLDERDVRAVVIPDDHVLRGLDEFTAEFFINPRSLAPGVLMMKTGAWNRDGFYLEIDDRQRIAFHLAREQRAVDAMWFKTSKGAAKPNAVDLSAGTRGRIGITHDPAMDDMTSFIIETELRFSELGDGGFLLKTKDWRREGFFFSIENERLVFGIGNEQPGGRPFQARSPSPLKKDRWYNIRIVKRDAYARLFIDDELLDEVLVPQNSGASAADIFIDAGVDIGLQIRKLKLTKLGDGRKLYEPLFTFGFEEGGGARLKSQGSDERSGKLLINQAAVKSPPKALTANRWQHVVLRKGKARSTLFIDGNEVADARTPGEIVDTPAPLLLGATRGSADVQIREFRLWRRSLTPKDIDALDIDKADPPADILAWFDFREGGDKVVRDLGKGDRHARIRGDGSPRVLVSADDDGAADTSDFTSASQERSALLAVREALRARLEALARRRTESLREQAASTPVPEFRPKLETTTLSNRDPKRIEKQVAKKPEETPSDPVKTPARKPVVAEVPAADGEKPIEKPIDRRMQIASALRNGVGTPIDRSDAVPPMAALVPTTAELIFREPAYPGLAFKGSGQNKAASARLSNETTILPDDEAGDDDADQPIEVSSAKLELPDSEQAEPAAPAGSSIASADERSPEAPVRKRSTPIAEPATLAKVEPAADTEQSGGNDGPGLVKAPDNAQYAFRTPVGQGDLVRIERTAADVVVADPNVANVRILAPNLIYVFGNGRGQTDIFVLDSSQNVLAKIKVDVTPDAEAATEALETVQPETKAEVEPALGGLVTEGIVEDTAEARDVAALAANLETPDLPVENNTSIVGSQQVNIRVRFAEVSRNDVFRLGLNWRALFETGNFLFGLTSGQVFQAAGGTDEIDLPFGNTGSVNYSTGDVNVDLLIDALQQEGVIRVLAEPNLTAVNGEAATFLAGGEVPIPVPGGDDGITIEFKQFGVSLDFTPTILPSERINLRVRPEVSELISTGGVLLEGFRIPAFSVRRTDTSVELASGQTFAIAGLFQRNITNDVDQFPGLGSLPILGALFTSKRYLRSETELVILITPYLVEPEGEDNLSIPGRAGTGETVRASHKPSPPRPAGPASFFFN